MVFEVVGPYLIEWNVVGEQRARDGYWKGSWRVHQLGVTRCAEPVAEGATGMKHSFCEAMTLAKNQAVAAASKLYALE